MDTSVVRHGDKVLCHFRLAKKKQTTHTHTIEAYAVSKLN